MTIAFDAKRAFQNTTGLGHYSRTLLSSLATYFPEHDYLLLAPRITDMFNYSRFPGMKAVEPSRFPGRFFRSAWRSSWVKKDLRKMGVNLYHGLSHEIPMGIEKTSIPAVVTMHDLIHERYPQQYNPVDVRIYRKKFSYACRHSRKIIAISRQTRDDIVAFYGIDARKIEVCYQSCHPGFYEAGQIPAEELERIRQQYRLPEDFYLYVGSVIERKNLLRLCGAVEMNRERLEMPLVVIGNGGAYMKQVLAYVKEKQLEERIIFLSLRPEAQQSARFRNAADFPAIYRMARALVYPSTFEGFGIPVLEAMAAGTPVITSNISCMPETGGPAALYIDPLNTAEMADALFQLLTRPQLAEEHIQKGYLHAANFTMEKTAQKVMEVYKSVIH